MVKVDWPRTGKAYGPRIRGVFLTQPDPRHGWLARSWPRKRGKAKQKPSVTWENLNYKFVAEQSTQPHYLDYENCVAWAKGTAFTWRDIFTMMMRGKFMILRNLDGTIWQNVLCMSDNPQYLLDLLDANPGAMLFRSVNGWQGIDAAADNYVLTMLGGVPVWLPNGATGNSVALGPSLLGNAVPGTFTAGFVGTNGIYATANITVTKITFFATAAAATAQMTPVIYAMNWPNMAALLKTGPTVTGAVAGKNTLPLSSGLALTAGTMYAVGMLGRVANVGICGPENQPTMNFAYNTNNTPPNPATSTTQGTTSWGGFRAEA